MIRGPKGGVLAGVRYLLVWRGEIVDVFASANDGARRGMAAVDRNPGSHLLAETFMIPTGPYTGEVAMARRSVYPNS
jgi:hypothetical protein